MNTPSRPLVLGSVVQSVSADEVYQVMTGAASQDPALFQASAARLKELLEMFGTYDALHEIAAQKAVPLVIRQQSIIQFKNAASSHWRSRKVLSDEHRIRIRTRCFTFLDEEDDTIAECNEVIVSKIARVDYPNNWPNLVDDLLKVIDSTFQKRFSDSVNEDMRDTLILRRSIKLLNSVLKEFSNAKMLNMVRAMSSVGDFLFAFCGYYSTLVFSSYLTNAYPATISPRAYTDLFLGHLVYKCISKLAIWLWNRLDRGGKEGIDSEAGRQWIGTLVMESGNGLQKLVDLRLDIIQNHMSTGLASNPYAQRCVEALTRHIHILGKFFRRLQELSAPHFASLPSCPALVSYYWNQVVLATKTPGLIADSNDAPYPVRFLVQGMVLFKDNLGQWKPVRRDGTENLTALSQDFVQNAVETLIQQFMPLKEAELNDWMADPEQWVNDEETDNEQWLFEIRPCSERVLMTLSNQFPDVVAPLLFNLYLNFATKPAGNLQEIIQKEALYCAIGRCAIRLKTMIPFDQWLQTTLAEEAQNTDPIYPIIKRRIAWLLGKWVSDECTSPANDLLWKVLIHLLSDRQAGSDAVVRMTAAIALRECIDTLEFDINVFAPYLPAAVKELVQLLGEADTFEIKRRVDYTLNAVIVQSGDRISDLVDIIVEPLPGLWAGAGEDWLFKASLLVTVTKLVEATKERSVSLTRIVVPLINKGLDSDNVANLDEDTMNLWLAALRNATSLHSQSGPALIDLFPVVLPILGGNLDLLGKAVDIIDSYFLLDGVLIMQTWAVDLFSALRISLSSAAVSTNLKQMILSLNLLTQIIKIQRAPASLWAEAMHTSGLFSLLIKTIAEGECGALLLTEHVLLMSRMVMADRQMFLQLMAATATPAIPELKLYDCLLDQWWGTWDSLSEPRHRKLSAMGIAALVSTARPDVLERLPGDIFNIWTDVLLELKEAKLTAPLFSEGVLSPLNLQRHWELNEAPPAYYQNTEGSPEFHRRKAVYDNDPVRTEKLSSYIAGRLNEAQGLCGAQAFHANYLSKADPAVLAMIQDQLIRD
ncbi:armadillo-type protein [Mycena maculata]|uniref:Armadillo-type protein n=1 Tax=Mycena maculata TaxID=230809 RepID=A0AAD7JK57_9AGAR|nr:armadillo-type protein [Mycena maculata]